MKKIKFTKLVVASNYTTVTDLVGNGFDHQVLMTCQSMGHALNKISRLPQMNGGCYVIL
jgi:hypothetical protein